MQRQIDKVEPSVKPIHYVPKKINVNDLQPPNQLLLNQDDIAKLKREHEQSTDGVVSYIQDKDIEIIKHNNKYYAVYAAQRKDKESGAFGTVYFMQDLESGEWLALKKQKDASDRSVKKENKALNELKQLHFEFKKDGKPSYHFSAMSLAPGVQLHGGVIKPNRKFKTVRWFDMAVSGLKNLQAIHEAGLLHRDIKPHNMVLDPASHTLKLVDLGLAVSYTSKEKKEFHTTSNETCGTEGFIAPELKECERLKKKIIYTEKTEVYSMGMTLAEMFGISLTPEDRLYGLAEIRQTISDPEMYNKVAEFIYKMIDNDPEKRPTLAEAIKFFEEARDIQLRAPDLLNRIATVDIEEHKDLFQLLEKLTILEEKHTLTTQESKALENIKVQIKQNESIKLLTEADEVWLVAPNDTTPEQLIKATRALEKLGIIVNSEALSYKKKEDIPGGIQSYAEQRERKDKNIYICANLKDGKLNYPDKISPRHLEKIIQTLLEDAKRLHDRDPLENSSRIRTINIYISELQQNKDKMTYDKLDRDLKGLQDKLYSNNGFMAMLEKAHIASSTTREHIAEIRKDSQQLQKKLKH